MIGGTIGRWRIDRELGSGGMGKVYAATAPDGEVAAIKVVHPHLVEQPGFRERFLREAKSGLAITSSNVVRTIECLEADVEGSAVPALVLEFVEGRDLADLLGETGRVPEDLCRHLAREIARGLQAVHDAGIVHRDMTPGNVLLTPAGDVKVMDLGLARQASGEDRMSQTGLFLGTVAYAPPEQFFGKKDLDPRSDLYSLGSMLFELATGRVPFEAESIGDLMRQVLRDRPLRIGTLAPQTTPFFEEIVATLLEKDPERRFASAAEVGEILDHGEASDWWAAASVRVQMESHRPLRRVRVPRETELWGREDDLAELRALWDVARRGDGAVALLEGEAGIGKTRLVEELIAAIELDDDAQILVGRHDPAGSGAAAEALAAAFRERLEAEDLDARLEELLPGNLPLVPAFAALLRAEAPPAGATALTTESVRTLFVLLARALAAEAPLVLVVDDLHFASDEGRALFRALALGLEASPVLIVGTARPGLPQRWADEIGRGRNALRHEVKRLGADTVREALIRHLGSGYEAETVAEQIVSRAGGNPYFVVEVLRHLGERGNLVRTVEGAWRVTSVPVALELPSTVGDLVAGRLAALAPQDRALLEAAACQGAEFDGRLVAETLGCPRMEILRALGRLEHTTSLVRAAGTRFTFDHHVVHEVLHGALDPATRARHHAAIAAALEARHGAATRDPAELDGGLCVEIAEHLLEGAEGARALRYLGPALTHLEARWANERAIRLADRALATESLLEGAKRASLLLRKAGRLDVLGRRGEEAAVLEEANALADAAGDAGLLGRARMRKGVLLFRTSQPDAAEAVLTEALEYCRQAGDGGGEAGATMNLGNVMWFRSRLEEAQVLYERAIAVAQAAGDRRAEAFATGNLGSVLEGLGRLDEARRCFERDLEIEREIGNRAGEASAIGNIANLENFEGGFDEIVALISQEIAIYREIGDRAGEAGAHGNLGNKLGALGRLPEALDRFERHAALSREVGNGRGLGIALVNVGLVRLSLGDLEGARAPLEEGLAVSRRIGAPYPEGYALHRLGLLAEETGDLAAARAWYEECLELRRRVGPSDAVASGLIALGGVLIRMGDVERARPVLDEALELARAFGSKSQEASALAYLTAVPGGDVQAAVGAVVAEDVCEGDPGPRVRSRLLLWKATGDPEHLRVARRHVDGVLAQQRPEHTDAMRRNVSAIRETLAACAEAGI